MPGDNCLTTNCPLDDWMVTNPVLICHCRGFSSRRGSLDPCETVEDEEENLARLCVFAPIRVFCFADFVFTYSIL